MNVILYRACRTTGYKGKPCFEAAFRDGATWLTNGRTYQEFMSCVRDQCDRCLADGAAAELGLPENPLVVIQYTTTVRRAAGRAPTYIFRACRTPNGYVVTDPEVGISIESRTVEGLEARLRQEAAARGLAGVRMILLESFRIRGEQT